MQSQRQVLYRWVLTDVQKFNNLTAYTKTKSSKACQELGVLANEDDECHCANMHEHKER